MPFTSMYMVCGCLCMLTDGLVVFASCA